MSSETPSEAPIQTDQEYPPLDAVNSRWWYWIAAYIGVTLLFIPFAILAGLAFLSPVIVAGPGSGPSVGAPIAFVFLLVAVFVLGFGILAFVIFSALPVALYRNARQVREADLDWKPEPIVDGGLRLLQFVETPIIGFLVAIYYLYQRHKHVDVP